MRIRQAAPGDARALLEIYARYIDTPITFEYALPPEPEFAERIAGIRGQYPYLLCEEDGLVAGYAYAHRHRERAAYQWNAELSVYLDPGFTARGLGKKMYGLLIELLRRQGIKTVYGGVTAPNAPSEALHRSLGFRHLGTCRNAGFKGGKWHDVMWFEKAIAPHDPDPHPILPINRLPAELIETILSS